MCDIYNCQGATGAVQALSPTMDRAKMDVRTRIIGLIRCTTDRSDVPAKFLHDLSCPTAPRLAGLFGPVKEYFSVEFSLMRMCMG